MSLFKASLLSTQAKTIFKTLTSLYKHVRPLNSSPQAPTKKPLSLLFEEAVGLTEKVGENESQSRSEKNELMRKLRELEMGVREFKENPEPKGKKEDKEEAESGKPKKISSLVGLFGGERKYEKVTRMVKPRAEPGEVTVLKDLSVFVEAFVRHLHSKGYFDKATFLVDNNLDFGKFDNSYGRNFIKFAAYQFGKDNQEIAKWVSSSRLKKVAAFGCPSLDKSNLFAAKRLRKIFHIQEDTICSQCVLKDSCKFPNVGVGGIATKSLLLVDVMKVIILYNLGAEHPKLRVPKEVRDSANKLLEEVMKLSQTT